jgi:hypothetical protein
VSSGFCAPCVIFRLRTEPTPLRVANIARVLRKLCMSATKRGRFLLELWYYADGEETRGPISAVNLVALLSKMPDPRTVMIWRHGFEDWKPTHEVPEIARQVVRPPPSRPKVRPPPANVRKPAVNTSDVNQGPSRQDGWLTREALRATSNYVVTAFFVLLAVHFIVPDMTNGSGKKRSSAPSSLPSSEFFCLRAT